MENLAIRLVDLEPMHVIAACGYGDNPELQAWDMILDFAAEHDLEPWDRTHRFFGFNNPEPTPDSSTYGYEQWMTIADEVDSAATPLEIKEVPGGRYATLRIHGLETIGDAWDHLVRWCENHGYHVAGDRTQCLEELLTPFDRPTHEWEMDLYLAVDKED
jgi:DNA gyrase inhibitor GyrI